MGFLCPVDELRTWPESTHWKAGQNLSFSLTSYFEVISYSLNSCKKSTENSGAPFTEIPQMLTFHHVRFIVPSLLPFSSLPH